MNKLFNFFLPLCLASMFCSVDAQQYVRPLHLDKDTMTVSYEGKSYLLVNGSWMETKAPNNADVKYDNVWLPTDKMKLSKSAEKEKVEDHSPLKAVLTYTRNVYKYDPKSPNIPYQEKKRVLSSDSTLTLKVVGDSVPFSLVVGDTAWVKGENWVTGKEINISLEELGLEKLDLKIDHQETKSISRIQIIPEGHTPSFVRDLHCIYNEKASQYWIEPKSPFEKFIDDYLWYIIAAGILLLAIIGYFIYIHFFKKTEESEYDNPHPQDSNLSTDSDSDIHRSNSNNPTSGSSLTYSTPQEEISDLRHKLSSAEFTIRSQHSQIDFSQRTITDLTQQKIKLQQEIKTAHEDERNRCKKEIDTLREDKQKLKDSLEEEKKSAKKKISDLQDEMKKKVSDAREEEKKKFEKKIADLTTEVGDLKADLKDTEADLSQTRKALDSKTLEWEHDERTIVEMKEAQRIYTERISFVPFAEQYAKNIERLLTVVARINESAKALANTNVEDPYLIYKAISRFSLAEKEIDFDTFLCDITMASKSQLAFSNSGIANLSSVADAQLQSSIRSYFLTNYLEKYINAVMVYNESLAGIHRLVDGLSPAQTEPFAEYREELKACFKQLGIAVISVKLFDTLGDNMDLKATMVDYDESIPAESIIEIQNCLVYPEGGRRPTDKIYVKAQK